MNKLLLEDRLKRPCKLKLMVIDDFYENPYDVRDFALQQSYFENIYHPGFRTNALFFSQEHIDKFQSYLQFIGCKEVISDSSYNGHFQYNTAEQKSWIHYDTNSKNTSNVEGWAGIVYLTPNAPLSSGTGFFKFIDGNLCRNDDILLKNEKELSSNCKDIHKFEIVTRIGNIFNRLILFKSDQYHISMDYFGSDIKNSRLIQLFFFNVIY